MYSQAYKPDVLNKAANLYKEMNAAADPNNLYRVKDRGNFATNFPVQLGSSDPDDLQMDLRQQVIKENGQVDGFGTAVADDRVFSYLERKKEAQIEADYQAWLISQADFSDPARADFWNNVAPWITQLKIDEINKNAELQKRLAVLKVTGPRTEDDFKLLYMIKSKIIVPPAKPVHEMDSDTTRYTNAENATDFVAGLFNPLTRKPNNKGFPIKELKKPTTWAQPLGAESLVGFSRNNAEGFADYITKMKARPAAN